MESWAEAKNTLCQVGGATKFLFGFFGNYQMTQMSRQSLLKDNKNDNEEKLASPGVYFTTEENFRKPQLGDHLKAESSPQIGFFIPKCDGTSCLVVHAAMGSGQTNPMLVWR
jgi:hypothetical protein